jgi:DNA-binding transcriptional LysR family regulator
MLHVMNLSELDLNHVRALHYLLEDAHVARSAKRLAITPAAASNALRRLRDEFSDPLLVRVGRRMQRTPLAERLRAPTRGVLEAAQRLLDVATPFDPLRFDGVCTLVAADRIVDWILPALDSLVRTRAPHARLHVRTETSDIARTLHDTGGVAIAGHGGAQATLQSEPLLSEGFVCVLSASSPAARGRWDLRKFVSVEHILVAPRGESARGAVDDALTSLGRSRNVSRVVSSFSTALLLAESSERIVVIPRSLAVLEARRRRLVTRKVPFALPVQQMDLLWQKADTEDASHTWFREAVRQAVHRRLPAR